MESIVFKDSPLAQYLEGEGEAPDQWASIPDKEPPSPRLQSFAPRGPATVSSKFRKKLPRPLHLELPKQGTIANIYSACSRAVNSTLSRDENARFLEQFRYIIVASQLLNEQVNPPYYDSTAETRPVRDSTTSFAPHLVPLSLSGAVVTAIGAFSFVWLLHWARGGRQTHWSKGRTSLVVALFGVLASFVYIYARRKWLQYLRQQAVNSASVFVADAQGFESATTTAITLIQEVELVSRGYRISAPLPPITRLEEKTQTRRCSRLRKLLRSCLATMIPAYSQACDCLKPLAEAMDLEKYFDIYDISTPDFQEVEIGYKEEEFEDMESLKALKILLLRSQCLRKIFLCCLLALEADGGRPDFARWGAAIDEMGHLSIVTEQSTEKLRRILNEEDHFTIPPTPKGPLTPGKERVRAQLRKLSSLSQGIRGLQAKMHVLREESDRTLDESEDVTELGSNLMSQYDSIGADLRALMVEWENGKAALALNIDKNERRVSSISMNSSGHRSSTPSLGGVTAVEGSPSDALRALNGEDKPRSGRSSIEASESDEEVFEAIAMPRQRQRSSLTREQRIAKMKEDRVRQSSVREKAEANTHMLRELETVINLRPRGRVDYRALFKFSAPLIEDPKTRVMLEARLEQANLLKKVVDAIKDLVQDCNFDCNDSGIALQAMDNSHVALVSMMLKAESFSPFRCDRNIALGINLTSLTKVLRCAQNEDILTLKAEDAPDVVNLVFESSESDRISEYDIKLMDIDQEHLGIPDTEYAATITMPSAEFQRICRDLMALSESVAIEATKDGVKFACQGDIGSGSVTLRSHSNVDKPDLNVDIELSEPVALTFSLKYLVNFCKASGLSTTVKLCLSNEVPLLVEYDLAGSSYLRFYLAPKIGDDE
ncbi:MAG: hypothetical protein M1819_002521 [Sarea resinae]|nr:MAG: hypothetical protein M1819_002521 [Sarea resinae]